MAEATSSRFGRDSAEFGRGLGFFDAVYGFALTLLIANVDAPSADQWQNIDTLLDSGLGSQLLGFVISFAVIAVFWRSNYGLLAQLNGVDGAVVSANIVAVGLVVFIPFTTQGISDSDVNDLPLPTVVYAINIMLAILAQMAMFEVARRRGLVAIDDTPAVRWATRVGALSTVIVFAISIPVAFLVDATAAKYVWLALVVIGPLVGRWSNSVVERARQTQSANVPQ